MIKKIKAYKSNKWVRELVASKMQFIHNQYSAFYITNHKTNKMRYQVFKNGQPVAIIGTN